MVSLFFSALIAALFVSLVTYLQIAAKWWTGPLTAVLLVVAGVAVALFLQSDPNSPAMGLVFAIWLSAIFVGLGTAIALIFRRFLQQGTLVKWTFWLSWAGGFAGLVLTNLV